MSPTLLVLAASIALAVLLSWLVPWLAGAAGLWVARRRGAFVRNYRGVGVPLGLGWAWVGFGVLTTIFAGVVAASPAAYGLGALVIGAALLGWLDDRFGERGTKGFGGHLGALRHLRVTTGVVKLVGIGVLSLYAAWGLPSVDLQTGGLAGIAVWLLGAAVIALTANLLNLLDLRPGRALKAYVPFALVGGAMIGVRGFVSSTSSPSDYLAVLVPVLIFLGPVLACWRADLGERGMLGDMGANAAGALAGWLLAGALPAAGLAIAAAVLLALNLASERVSFSAVIEGNAGLRWLDGLGRVRAEDDDATGETGT